MHSISTQAVAGGNLKFLDIATGYRGSIHDARNLRDSALYIQAKRNILLTEPTDAINGYKIRTLLIGDGAYLTNTWLVKPFPNNLNSSPKQKKINRFCSRRCFWDFKGKMEVSSKLFWTPLIWSLKILSNKFSRNLLYSITAFSLTLKTIGLYFTIRKRLSILVTLLKATYIWPSLNNIWFSKSKLTTTEMELKPCTLWTVQDYHNSARGNCVFLIVGNVVLYLLRHM